MSSSQPPGSDPSTSGQNRRYSIGKVLSKWKSAMSRRQSRAGSTVPTVQTVPTTETTMQPLTTAANNDPTPVNATNTTETSVSRIYCEQLEVDENATSIPSAPLRLSVPIKRGYDAQTRAKLLWGQYDLNYEEWGLPMHEDGPRSDLPRVEKKIKMRVRYSCHLCNKVFSQTKVCHSCGHNKCRDCPRDPARRRREWPTFAQENQSLIPPQHLPSEQLSASESQPTHQPIIHRSSQAPGRPVQRVQYLCHQCETLFVLGTAHSCPNCGHRRCNSCRRQLARVVVPPSDPNEKIQLEPDSPDSPPKERVWKRTRQRIKYACHSCQKGFKHGENVCSTCNHERCDQCGRIPPKKLRVEAPDFAPAEASSS